jgi:PAS domain-containing protein
LTDAASHFGEGHLAERAVIETQDEVGTLAGTFNRMAESLESRFDELQRQSAFIKEVLDNLPLGVAVLDDRLLVRTANRKFKESVGRSGDALRGRGLYESAAGLAKLSEIIEDVRRTRQTFVTYGLTLELVAPPSGALTDEHAKKFWDVIIYPTHGGDGVTERGDLLLILNEVSDRVRAESLATIAFAAERARGAELSSVINQMNDGVVIVDRKGLYRINPMAAKILGRDPGGFRDGVEALIEDFDLHDIGGRKLAPEETPLRRALDKGERIAGENLKIYRATTRAGNTLVVKTAKRLMLLWKSACLPSP